MASENKKWYHRKIILIVAGIIFITSPIWGLFVKIQYTKHQIANEIAGLRAAGIPTTIEDLKKEYESNMPYPNAANLYLEAFKYFNNYDYDAGEGEFLPVFGVAHLDRTDEMPPKMRSGIEKHLEKNEQFIILLKNAAEIPEAKYPLTFTKFWVDFNNNYGNVRNSVRILVEDAIYAAEINDAERAVSSLAAAYSVSPSISNQNIVVSELVWGACIDIIRYHSQRIFTKTILADEQLLLLEKKIGEALKTVPRYEKIMEWEIAIELNLFSEYIKHNPGEIADAILSLTQESGISYPKYFKYIGLLEKGMLESIRNVKKHREMSKLPLRQSILSMKEVGDEAEALSKETFCGHSAHPFLWISSALYRGRVEEVRAIAYLRVQKTAIAIERFRLKKERLPENLEELVPDFLDKVPEDPFDEKPLKYKKLPAGYTIYSIGDNFVDDGGTERGIGEYPYADLTFTVER